MGITMSPEDIFNYAKNEAEKAAVMARLKGHEDAYCGFAWVKITPARGKFVNYLKSNNIGRNGIYGGWEVSSNVFNPHNTQSLTFKEVISSAFANALNEHGIRAYVQTRSD